MDAPGVSNEGDNVIQIVPVDELWETVSQIVREVVNKTLKGRENPLLGIGRSCLDVLIWVCCP